MSWVKIDDQFTDHPKIIEAGPLAGWLFVCGLTYSARYLTDGFIALPQLRRIADVKNPQALAEKLVAVGLWETADGGYQVHNYLNYNPSAEKVKAERDAAKERMHRVRSGDVRANKERSSLSPTRPVVPNGTSDARDGDKQEADPFDPTRQPKPDPLAEEKAALIDANPHWEKALEAKIAEIREQKPIRHLLPLECSILRGWRDYPDTAPKKKRILRTPQDFLDAGYIIQ